MRCITLIRCFGEGLIARMEKDDVKARAAFEPPRGRPGETICKPSPTTAPAICVLGLIDAGLGNKEAALREGRRAMELLPYSETDVDQRRAHDRILRHHRCLGGRKRSRARTPGTRQSSSRGFGTMRVTDNLKLTPYWDPLRGDPRFEKIVASLAPKG